MNKVRHFLQMGAFLFCLAGCQSYDRSANLVLVNNSDRTVCYSVTCDSAFRDLALRSDRRMKPHESVMPYLLWGAEGNGPNNNTWINAINRADDSALHIFFYYIDFKGDPNLGDSLYHLIIRRRDYKVDSLVKLNWRVEYN